jgi:SNF2 family DNA or RNA helicase
MPQVRMINPYMMGVKTNLRENPSMHRIPGSKYQGKKEEWNVPFNLFSCQQLRRVYGDLLEVEEEVFDAARNAKARIARAKEIKTQPIIGEYGWQPIATQFMNEFKTVILADDMGLGKSKETLDTFGKGPHLIITTNTMKYEWEKEVHKWGLDMPVQIFNAKDKKQVYDEGITIINWEAIRSHSKLVSFGGKALSDKEKELKVLNQKWETVVLDEAHKAKDPTSKQTRAAWAIGLTAEKRFALTGTPIANSPVDLWALLHFVDPLAWPSKTHFINRYCLSYTNHFKALEIEGLNPATEPELLELIEPYFIRRTKAQVGIKLPPLIYRDISVPLTTKQATAYKGMKKEMLTLLDSGVLLATDPLTQLGRLAQIASGLPVLDEEGNVTALSKPSSKLDKFKDIIENTDEPILVFAHSRLLIDLVSEELKDIPHGLIVGGQKPVERSGIITNFQNGELRFLLVSLQAGAEGMTLTNASTVVFLEKPWSQIQWLQAPGRVDRIGQTADEVEIISLVAHGTVEELITPALAQKYHSLQQICRDEEFWQEVLTKD